MAKDWDIIITNKSNLLSIDFDEIWRYRDLLAMYVKRDIVTFYKQTILGPLWFVIQPLFTTIMFMFVVLPRFLSWAATPKKAIYATVASTRPLPIWL